MRNRGLQWYRPAQAQQLRDNRWARATKSIKITDEVLGWIEQLIRQELSPQQVGDYLKTQKNLLPHHETLYTVIIRLTGKHDNLLTQAAIKRMKALKDKIETITFDNRLEFSKHQKICICLRCLYLLCACLCLMGARNQLKYKWSHTAVFSQGH